MSLPAQSIHAHPQISGLYAAFGAERPCDDSGKPLRSPKATPKSQGEAAETEVQGCVTVDHSLTCARSRRVDSSARCGRPSNEIALLSAEDPPCSSLRMHAVYKSSRATELSTEGGRMRSLAAANSRLNRRLPVSELGHDSDIVQAGPGGRDAGLSQIHVENAPDQFPIDHVASREASFKSNGSSWLLRARAACSRRIDRRTYHIWTAVKTPLLREFPTRKSGAQGHWYGAKRRIGPSKLLRGRARRGLAHGVVYGPSSRAD